LTSKRAKGFRTAQRKKKIKMQLSKELRDFSISNVIANGRLKKT
jgi:hypothetical protein